MIVNAQLATATRCSIGRLHRNCPNCDSPELEYEFIIDRQPVCSCRQCFLLFLNPQPTAEMTDPASLNDEDAYYNRHREVRSANAITNLARLFHYAGSRNGPLLIIASDPVLEMQARGQGLDVVRLSVADAEKGGLVNLRDREFQACILYCALEKLSDPLGALAHIRRSMHPDGALMVICPALDSQVARLLRTRWWEFRKANQFYYSSDTLQNLLIKAGFGDPKLFPDDAVVSARYLLDRVSTLPKTVGTRVLRLSLKLLKASGFGNHKFRMLHNRVVALVRPVCRRSVPRLSIVVPAYNEISTFSTLMDQLLAKTVEGVDIEIILVESNSNDGTREEAIRYGEHPRVQLILQDQPRGKGHAVRAGLAVATGDLVLIQDADLEYDIEDYDALLKPILQYQQNFVIGSRHTFKGQVWKIRQFSDSMSLSAFFNLGHLIFQTLLNVMYAQKLNDPFSMYKVFRRDCLYGLTFECNRFDFDFEIAIKLIRKGYRPIELPVNYRSRSLRQGKKVRMFRDPLTWIRALIRFRMVPLYAAEAAKAVTRPTSSRQSG
jgi:hypothetical protein